MMASIRIRLRQTPIYAEVRYVYRTARIVLTRGQFLRDEWQEGEFTWEPLPGHQRNYDQLFSRAECNFAETLNPYRKELTWLVGRVQNGVFMSPDPELLYSMVRRHQPKRVIEVGSGHSTWFISEALSRNGFGNVLSIDPAPRRSLPSRVELVRKKYEDMGIEPFQQLEAGDLLFIDASHTRETAVYYTQHIFRVLHCGVIIHIHDIAYPFLPACQEEPVVLEFFDKHDAEFEVITGCAFVARKSPELVQELIPSYRWCSTRPGTSLWARKR